MVSLFEMFGWKIKKSPEKEPESFVPEIQDDGAVLIASGGSYGSYLDLESSARSEAELVSRYRDMVNHPEVDEAANQIVNQAIVTDEDEEYVVRAVTDNVEGVSAGVKKKIEDEFKTILKILDFNNNATDIFKRWYVDGRLYYHVIIDETKHNEGIQELRYVDPRKIRKIREIENVNREGYILRRTKAEYYVYNDRGFAQLKNPGQISPDSAVQTGLRIEPDAILHCTSGVMDQNNQLVYSHLHKAIKVLNQLTTLEDATVIYRISRAPERRIFYIDVGNLPKVKAEQYLRDVMVKHKNRLVYDANTGEIRDDRKFMTLMEDYWFARRDGGRGTEVTTLPAGQNLGEMEDVEYFRKKLYKALGIPVSRLEPDLGATLGRASEISRDEIEYAGFITRLRRRFNQLFLKMLEKQLILKRIILPEEWNDIAIQLRFKYLENNHFEEMKSLEILANRMSVLEQMTPYIGIAYSWRHVRKTLLKMTDEDIEQMDSEIAEEKDNEQFLPPDIKMLMLQQQYAPEPIDAPEEEDDPYLGHPIEDEEDEDETDPEDQGKSLGRPTIPPPGKKNGPDEPKTAAGKPKAKTKPAAKKK